MTFLNVSPLENNYTHFRKLNNLYVQNVTTINKLIIIYSTQMAKKVDKHAITKTKGVTSDALINPLLCGQSFNCS